jgi:hypothetical protein
MGKALSYGRSPSMTMPPPAGSDPSRDARSRRHPKSSLPALTHYTPMNREGRMGIEDNSWRCRQVVDLKFA